MANSAHSHLPPPARPHKPLEFLSLPREIRDEIYRNVVVSPSPILFTKKRSYGQRNEATELFLTNRQVFREASAIFFAENTFLYSLGPYERRSFRGHPCFHQMRALKLVVQPSPHPLPSRFRDFIAALDSYAVLALQKLYIDVQWYSLCFQNALSIFEDIDRIFLVSFLPDFAIYIKSGQTVHSYSSHSFKKIRNHVQSMHIKNQPSLCTALDFIRDVPIDDPENGVVIYSCSVRAQIPWPLNRSNSFSDKPILSQTQRIYERVANLEGWEESYKNHKETCLACSERLLLSS